VNIGTESREENEPEYADNTVIQVAEAQASRRIPQIQHVDNELVANRSPGCCNCTEFRFPIGLDSNILFAVSLDFQELRLSRQPRSLYCGMRNAQENASQPRPVGYSPDFCGGIWLEVCKLDRLSPGECVESQVQKVRDLSGDRCYLFCGRPGRQSGTQGSLQMFHGFPESEEFSGCPEMGFESGPPSGIALVAARDEVPRIEAGKVLDGAVRLVSAQRCSTDSDALRHSRV